MSDYINKEYVMALINKSISHVSLNYETMSYNHGVITGLNMACDIIDALSSKDVEEVVRCKDCINNDRVCGGEDDWCYKLGFNCNPDGFCSEGEK